MKVHLLVFAVKFSVSNYKTFRIDIATQYDTSGITHKYAIDYDHSVVAIVFHRIIHSLKYYQVLSK